MKTSTEFQVGKHNIGYLYDFDKIEEETFEQRPMPTFQKLLRTMTDAEIEKEITKGKLCTLGDVLAFLDDAPGECKDEYANLFYLPSFVVNVYWLSGYPGWRVRTWDRDGGRWRAGPRVFSPATDTQALGSESSDALALVSLDARLKKIESLFNPELLIIK